MKKGADWVQMLRYFWVLHGLTKLNPECIYNKLPMEQAVREHCQKWKRPAMQDDIVEAAYKLRVMLSHIRGRAAISIVPPKGAAPQFGDILAMVQ
eukprot:3586474-Alexandrium_andersonii.AAC.1